MEPREVELTIRMTTDAPERELESIDGEDVQRMVGTLWYTDLVRVTVRVVEP
jgi:hypothetical protein